MLADLKSENWEFLSAEELLAVLKKEFGKKDNKSVKVVKFR